MVITDDPEIIEANIVSYGKVPDQFMQIADDSNELITCHGTQDVRSLYLNLTHIKPYSGQSSMCVCIYVAA